MQDLSLADYLAILKRWQKCFLTTFLSLLAVVTVVTLTWSNYRSSATVEIEQPQVAAIMTAPTGIAAGEMPTALADLRISRIQEKVVSPSSLVDIITKFNLYTDQRSSKPMAEIARKMESKIKLNFISSTIANPAASSKVSVDQLSAIAFTLSFDYPDPQIARAVNSELVTRFLDADLKERREGAEATSAFLDQQIKMLEASLVEQEKKIAQFKDEHGLSGPEALMFNQQAAVSAVMTMQSLDSQISTNEGSQGAVRAQLTSVDPYSRVIADGQILTTPETQLKALQAQLTTLSAQYGPEHPDVMKISRQIDALRSEAGDNGKDTAVLKSQIKDVETNLVAAKNSYGEDNPDVISLKHQLDSLRKELIEARKSGGSKHGGLKKDADNPAYLAMIAQLDSLNEQHKSLVEQRSKLAEQHAKYEQAIARDPALEQEMAVLTRDHDNAQLRYREMKERKMAADMDVQMIEDHKGEHLAVISPPSLPQHTQPQRILLFIGGLFMSFMGGLGTVIIAQLFRQCIIGTRHLTNILGIPPLVTIPHISTQQERNNLPARLWGKTARTGVELGKTFFARLQAATKGE